MKKANVKKNAYFELSMEKIQTLRRYLRSSIQAGILSPIQVRIVILFFLVLFSGYVVLFKQCYDKNFLTQNDTLNQKTSREIEVDNLKRDLNALVKGSPMEKMVPYIAEQDRTTAAYMIGIAKKESNWGSRKPVLAGQDCFNYWGFRLTRARMGSGGHTCFDSPREAVNVVAGRIQQIIERNNAQSAKKMLVWKCGSDCSVTGGQASADKWAQDVDLYAQKVLN